MTKLFLVPDSFGKKVCQTCYGYMYANRYSQPGDVDHEDVCPDCQGQGRFREETEIVPIEGDLTFRSPEIKKDSYGSFVHTCGGGLRFYMQSLWPYWSCASCRNYGALSETEWELAQAKQPPLATLAQARGADVLKKLLKELRQ